MAKRFDLRFACSWMRHYGFYRVFPFRSSSFNSSGFSSISSTSCFLNQFHKIYAMIINLFWIFDHVYCSIWKFGGSSISHMRNWNNKSSLTSNISIVLWKCSSIHSSCKQEKKKKTKKKTRTEFIHGMKRIETESYHSA